MSSKNESTKHVAIVGITGVGKSTLVNVLTGSSRAKANNNAVPCTDGRRPYNIQEEGITYTLWDTKGLNEGSEREATSSAVRFFQRLRILPDAERQLRKFLVGKKPKIDLILFCIHATKIQVDAQWRNYDKIYDKFCQKKINIAVVVTQIGLDTWGSESWKRTCREKARGAVGIEGVPEFWEQAEDTKDCKCRILKLISNCS